MQRHAMLDMFMFGLDVTIGVPWQICILLLVPCSLRAFRHYEKDYTGSSVIRTLLDPRNPESVTKFYDLYSALPHEVDLWGAADLYVPQRQLSTVLSALGRFNFSHETLVQDVQSFMQIVSGMDLVNRQKQRKTKRSTTVESDILGTYATYDEISEWLQGIAKSAPHLVKLTTIGTSHQGKNITLAKLGIETGQAKPAIWLDGGVHAREWISPASVIYVIHTLVNGSYHLDSHILPLLRDVDWYVVPLVNPDGYMYSQEIDRFWRKNVSPDLNGTGCLGVDLNRNFDFHWGEAASSAFQCAWHYRGIRPGSEPETQAISQAVLSRRNQLKAFITVHSYAQLWLTRWSYTNLTVEDDAEQMALAEKATLAVLERSGYNYTAGPPYKVLYTYSGGSSDWAKGVAGIKYSYCIELRDQGQYGFLLPEDQILPVGDELFAALQVVARQVLSESDQNIVVPNSASSLDRTFINIFFLHTKTQNMCLLLVTIMLKSWWPTV